MAQITNATGYPEAYEIYTSHVYRDDEGWSSGMGSNGNLAVIPTSGCVRRGFGPGGVVVRGC